MNILVVHPTSNQNNRNLLIALEKKKYLKKFITIANFSTNNLIFKFLPNKIINFLKRRDFSKITNKIYTPSITSQILYFLKLKVFKNPSTMKHYHYIDKIAAKYLKKNIKNIDIVYCYEDCALETFRVAKKNNIKCIYELPIGHWKEKNKILTNENDEHYPSSITQTLKHSYKEGYKKNLELKLADQIIVPTKFVKNTLKKLNLHIKNIKIIPYGFHKVFNRKKWSLEKSKKIKILFVGGLHPRKGIKYLLSSIKTFDKDKKITCLTIVGNGPLEKYIKNQYPNINYIKSIPHNQVIKLMKQNDIFILPTLFEGFALVLTEAMSNGMVVMSTKSTCLPEITNGKDCIIIKTKNSNSIVNNLIKINRNRNIIKKIGLNAIKTSKKYSWIKYHNKIVKNLENFMNDKE